MGRAWRESQSETETEGDQEGQILHFHFFYHSSLSAFPHHVWLYMATMVIKPCSFHNTFSSSFKQKEEILFLAILLRKNNGHIALHNEISLISLLPYSCDSVCIPHCVMSPQIVIYHNITSKGTVLQINNPLAGHLFKPKNTDVLFLDIF